jgi:hypothetical protein
MYGTRLESKFLFRPADFRLWLIATFRCIAEFGRYQGLADFAKPSARQIYGFSA